MRWLDTAVDREKLDNYFYKSCVKPPHSAGVRFGVTIHVDACSARTTAACG